MITCLVISDLVISPDHIVVMIPLITSFGEQLFTKLESITSKAFLKSINSDRVSNISRKIIKSRNFKNINTRALVNFNDRV
ncbi:hypothetical protein BpHYR1_047425 [Brachionus plicatilis]|uniref:Uncharacterized protein n=1 Tax=Brachionus plicatilis TaxID=10195 RepID=A0A3M7T292_BRAPC|nr:hypothetical protein BpHYR1_047425 [Brachionus plicatilis]